MADRPWQTELGLVAVFLWSGFIGIPVLMFHINSYGLDFGEHLHAAVMFIASQALVFWLAARPRKSKPGSASALHSVRPPVAAAVPLDGQIWEAELVTTTEWTTSETARTTSPTSVDSPTSTVGCATKLIIANYLGSSRPRVVYIEPGGTNCTLLPGQELEVTATSQGMTPAFRIVESDIATQVYVEGARIAVAGTHRSGRVHGAVHEEGGDQP